MIVNEKNKIKTKNQNKKNHYIIPALESAQEHDNFESKYIQRAKIPNSLWLLKGKLAALTQ